MAICTSQQSTLPWQRPTTMTASAMVGGMGHQRYRCHYGEPLNNSITRLPTLGD
jgi:hypothetical protein